LNLLWQVARQKTGEFYSLASRSGARVATDDHKCIDLHSDFGHHLGMLIQIGDDMNGLWTNNNQRSDLLSGKWTLPVAYIYEQAKSSLMKAAQPGKALEGLLGLLDLAIPKRGL
jgi:geranylgeranyl pyrophosphate synthase